MRAVGNLALDPQLNAQIVHEGGSQLVQVARALPAQFGAPSASAQYSLSDAAHAPSRARTRCKLPAQELFSELGLPLRVSPNFETQECQWSFGEAAPHPADDPTWPKGCVQGCTSREAMKELSGAAVGRVCE